MSPSNEDSRTDCSASLGGWRRSIVTELRKRRLSAARDDFDDLFAVEPSVLDEDRPGVDAGDGAAGDEQPRHVRFKRLGIVDGRLAIVQRDARAAQQIGVGSIAGQQIYSVRGQLFLRTIRTSLEDDRGGTNLLHDR